MTQQPPKPIPATHWQDLPAIADFPILAESRQRIRRQMQSSRATYQDLAVFVEADPALCLHLLNQTVEQNPDCEAQISGAASCLSLLGMQELVRLVKQLPVVSADSEEPHLQLYRRCLHTAQFAGELAAYWTSQKGSGGPDYARWCAMLANAQLWGWILSNPLSANWLHFLSSGNDLVTAARATFGQLKKREWEQRARQLHLPASAIELFQPDIWPTAHQWRLLRHHDPRDLDGQRTLLHHGQKPAFSCLMANGLAWHWHMAPEGKHSRRWLQLTAHWLGKHESMVWEDARQLQVRLSHQQRDGLSCGLQWLASPSPTQHLYPAVYPEQPTTAPEPIAEPHAPPPPPQKQQTPSDAATPEPALAASQPKNVAESPSAAATTGVVRATDDGYLKKLLRQLQQEPDRFGDWHFLLRSTLKGMTHGLGFPHACAALMNKQHTAMKVAYTDGMNPNMAMNRLTVDLRRANLFSKVMEKKASLLLTPANRGTFLKGLPDDVIDILPEHLLLMAIDAGHHAIGIIMAFDDSGTLAITADEYRQFKQLCQTTSKSLAALRENTRQRRS
ncbi:hypothetical protein CHH28_09410 [Bacterioplanes sanyensis]|uniref:HDOD domain-containing protein n=1 Tax=Bacterioplanes sanyensis TaxID=1249553 RepID=A0A222FJX4_9GAMM|nr:hypothetical protein [Bacterioplanes sanyensis]ASP38886.1 hypothetical protein CHH28_09410 [Bacterioplanes sanyensis]